MTTEEANRKDISADIFINEKACHCPLGTVLLAGLHDGFSDVLFSTLQAIAQRAPHQDMRGRKRFLIFIL